MMQGSWQSLKLIEQAIFGKETMKRLIYLSCLALAGCGGSTPEAASKQAEPPEAARLREISFQETAKMLVGKWAGQSGQIRLTLEFRADGTVTEGADTGTGWKAVDEAAWKIVNASGDKVVLEFQPKGKASYQQTDVFEGSDKFTHTSGAKVITFVRQ